jgi:hypothetical protein
MLVLRSQSERLCPLRLWRATIFGVKHKGADHQGNHDCDVGRDSGLQEDEPRPCAGEVDGEDGQRGAGGYERDDPQTLPNRVRPKRPCSHVNSVSRPCADVVDPNVVALPRHQGPAPQTSLNSARAISAAFECRRRGGSTRRSCSCWPRVRRRGSRTPRRSPVAWERARLRRAGP